MRAATRRGPLLPIAMALILRVAIFMVVSGHPERFYTVDAHQYVTLAHNLKASYVDLRSDLESLSLLRTPGYPVFIAIVSVFGEPYGIVISQILISVGTVYLTYRLASRLFGHRSAYWASILLGVDPISVIYANYVQPETLFTFLLLLASLYWWEVLSRVSPSRASLAGFLSGLAALIRPIGAYLPVVWLPLGALLPRAGWQCRLAACLAFLVSFAIPVGGWVARNTIVTGVPLLSTVASQNLLYYRAAGAVAEELGISLHEARAHLQNVLEQSVSAELSVADRSRYETALALETLFQHPRGLLVSALKGAASMLFGPGRASLFRLLGDPEPTKIDKPHKVLLIALEALILGSIYLGVGLGLYWLVRRGSYRELTFLLSTVVYFLLISAGPEAYARFRVPVVPYLTALAGYGYGFREAAGNPYRESRGSPPTGSTGFDTR